MINEPAAENDDIVVHRVADTDKYFAISNIHLFIEDDRIIAHFEVAGDINAAKMFVEETIANTCGKFYLKGKT